MKTAMTCPFSRKACRECAVYRGRHFYLCMENGFRTCEWDMTKYCRAESRKSDEDCDKTFMILTGFTVSPRAISNIEDLIEEEEFLRPKEKGEKHDT